MALEVLATAAIATAPAGGPICRPSVPSASENIRAWFDGEPAAGALAFPEVLDTAAVGARGRSHPRAYDAPSPSDTEVGVIRPAHHRKRSVSLVEDATPSWKDLRRLIRRHPAFNEDRAGFLSRFGHGARSISDLDKASLLRIARHLGIVFNEPEQKRSRSQWSSHVGVPEPAPLGPVAAGPAGAAEEDRASCESGSWGPTSAGSDHGAFEEAPSPSCGSCVHLEKRLAHVQKAASCWDSDEEGCRARGCRKELAEIAQLLALAVKRLDQFERAHQRDFQ